MRQIIEVGIQKFIENWKGATLAVQPSYLNVISSEINFGFREVL